MKRQDLIRKLVTTGHLNVPERIGLGAPITRQEVFGIISEALAANRFFPLRARPWTAGELCYEGRFIEATTHGAYRLYCQRPPATNPWMLAESTFRDFDTLESAVNEYIEREIAGDIDGVQVV